MKYIRKVIISTIMVSFIINSFCFGVSAVTKNEENLVFKRITIEDGLSQTTAIHLFQDSRGYMWIATADGLNRYNGHEFEVYRYNEGSDRSLSGNYINVIKEDEYGDIWVGTNSGLSIIDTETNKIKNYYSDINGCNLSGNSITEILIDSKNNVYIATTKGLSLYNRADDNFIRLYGEENYDEKNYLTSQDIYTIAEDSLGNLWVGTKSGLNKINRETNKITNYYANGAENSISGNYVYDLYAEGNNLWIATENKGLNKLNIKTNKMEYYMHDPNDENSIPSNSVSNILRDSKRDVWVATSEGLSKFDEKTKKFTNYKSKIYDPQSLVNNEVLYLTEDNSGSIWVGTYDGISVFNTENAFKNYKKDYFNDNSLSDNMIAGIYKDNDGLIWVGTVHDGVNVIDRKNNTVTKYLSSEDENSITDDNIQAITGIDDEIWIATDNGLTKYDKKTEKFTKYFNNGRNSLISNEVRNLYIDDDKDLWIATKDGLCLFDRKNKFKSYKELFLRKGITDNEISGIVQDKDGDIWVGTGSLGQLVRLNKKTNDIKIYKNDVKNKNTVSYGIIWSIAVDKKNNVWVGTQNGLNKFNREDETFTRYTESSGLSNNYIYGILVDSEGDLWISTNYGISKYDISEDKFVNYDVTDGLQGNEFNGFAYHKAYDGEMFFGGINGLTTFYPQELKEKIFIPEVVIENAYSDKEEQLDINNINLSYKNNNINFNFFLPDYRNVKKTQYSYKLEGLETEWNLSDNRNYANYTNLEGGKYTFMVKARNSTGEWSEPTSIEFTVKDKPWKTPLAYISYILIIIIAVYIIWNRVKILDSMVEQRTIQLNNKLKENEELYNKLIENEKYKNNYFINLSHELRTPLNIIISVEQLITKLNEDNKLISKEKLSYYMKTIARNSTRLLNLINNIIDTSKIESGSYKLDIKEHNIVYLVEDIVLSMKELIESKGIELIIDPDIEEKIIECDEVEIEKCIINLVANAVKFTESGGSIEVKIIDLDESVKICVKDTGVGIEKKYRETIFDRFGQAYNDVSEEFGGSGLGLTLTKQIVTLHNGIIFVKSEVNVGSEFIIILPTKQRNSINIDSN